MSRTALAVYKKRFYDQELTCVNRKKQQYSTSPISMALTIILIVNGSANTFVLARGVVTRLHW
jgi:hypothetical protein